MGCDDYSLPNVRIEPGYPFLSWSQWRQVLKALDVAIRNSNTEKKNYYKEIKSKIKQELMSEREYKKSMRN